MREVKRVLVPGLFADERAAEAVFAESPDVELVYGLSRADRAPGFTGERVAERTAAMQAGIERHLPQAHAVHAMGITGHLPFTSAMMDSAPLLQVLFIQAAGTDMIDVAAATERGILVVNAPGANAPAVAEHALGLMLALSRQIAETDGFAHRERTWARMRMTGPRALSTLAGKTLGLVGYGFVGRTLAQMCRAAFDMHVVAFDPFFDRLEARRQGVTMVDLDALLTSADVVSVATPLNDQTRRIIDGDALALMKPTALLINVGRGGTVDTGALVDALRAGAIAGAGLDVSDPEPLPDGHPLFELDNVVLTPHCGGAALEVMAPTAVTASELALEALHGRRPRHLINPAAWERHVERFHAAAGAGAPAAIGT
jgi:D-3-phosphoglycerate dehydrogenase / 2-oxoglutarate reductase